MDRSPATTRADATGVRPTMAPTLTLPLLILVLFFLSVLTLSAAAWIGAIIAFALGKPLLPKAPTRVVPWGVWSVLAVIVGYLVLQVVVGVAYSLLVMRGRRIPTPRDQLIL